MSRRVVIEVKLKHVEFGDAGFTVAKGKTSYLTRDLETLQATKAERFSAAKQFRYQDITSISLRERIQKYSTGVPFLNNKMHEGDLYIYAGDAWTVCVERDDIKKIRDAQRILCKHSSEYRWANLIADAGRDSFTYDQKRFFSDGRVVDAKTGELEGTISKDSPVVFSEPEVMGVYSHRESGWAWRKIQIGSIEIGISSDHDIFFRALDHFCGIKVSSP